MFIYISLNSVMNNESKTGDLRRHKADLRQTPITEGW